MWGLLTDLELVDRGDELVVKDILAGDTQPRNLLQIVCNRIAPYLRLADLDAT